MPGVQLRIVVIFLKNISSQELFFVSRVGKIVPSQKKMIHLFIFKMKYESFRVREFVFL